MSTVHISSGIRWPTRRIPTLMLTTKPVIAAAWELKMIIMEINLGRTQNANPVASGNPEKKKKQKAGEDWKAKGNHRKDRGKLENIKCFQLPQAKGFAKTRKN